MTAPVSPSWIRRAVLLSCVLSGALGGLSAMLEFALYAEQGWVVWGAARAVLTYVATTVVSMLVCLALIVFCGLLRGVEP